MCRRRQRRGRISGVEGSEIKVARTAMRWGNFLERQERRAVAGARIHCGPPSDNDDSGGPATCPSSYRTHTVPTRRGTHRLFGGHVVDAPWLRRCRYNQTPVTDRDYPFSHGIFLALRPHIQERRYDVVAYIDCEKATFYPDRVELWRQQVRHQKMHAFMGQDFYVVEAVKLCRPMRSVAVLEIMLLHQ
mmetsp:Transcript_12375/g.24664  ORF Transcript_12375/g.24664 Transcript_12375/m.24664 type:complete len:189 (+) Transcript_12375:276-842(+)